MIYALNFIAGIIVATMLILFSYGCTQQWQKEIVHHQCGKYDQATGLFEWLEDN